MPKICPLRMLAQESDWDSLNNMGSVSDRMGFSVDEENLKCLGENCAWWNDDFGACAIAALATVATRPVVLKERMGENA